MVLYAFHIIYIYTRMLYYVLDCESKHLRRLLCYTVYQYIYTYFIRAVLFYFILTLSLMIDWKL